MQIVPYCEAYKKDFIALNTDWLEKLFGEVEAWDKKDFENVEKTLAEGGQIYFALDEQGAVLACCMVVHFGENVWEVCKFAARGQYTGTGAGYACLSACIEHAKAGGARRIFVVSNTKCEAALHLYRKAGFREVPFNHSPISLKRANITMELYLL